MSINANSMHANVVNFPVNATSVNDGIVLNAFSIAGRKFANVPVDQMRIDYAYQRLSSRNMMKIAQNWDMNRCGILVVNYRDGLFFVIDGQHRMQAAQMNGITFLPCEMYSGLTQEQEAALFARQNEYVTKLSPYDVFKANLVIGDEVDTAIAKICEEFNVIIKKGCAKKGEARLGSITAARNIVQHSGTECLRWIFSTINLCGWSSMHGAYCSSILHAFYVLYKDHKNRPTAAARMIARVCEGLSPDLLTTTAVLAYADRGIGTTSATIAYLKGLIEEKSMAVAG